MNTEILHSNKKLICAQCQYWEMGDFWGTGSGKHGFLVESKGWCKVKRNKRKRWNYCPACGLFKKEPRQGFIYEGGGGNTIEEDLNNITELFKEMAEDNYDG